MSVMLVHDQRLPFISCYYRLEAAKYPRQTRFVFCCEKKKTPAGGDGGGGKSADRAEEVLHLRGTVHYTPSMFLVITTSIIVCRAR